MSRTIRRKSTKYINYLSEKHYTHEPAPGYELPTLWWHPGPTPKMIPKKGVEFKKGWWKFHNDTLRFRNKLFRSGWGQVRNKNRKNLNKWLRDPDNTECFFWEDVNTQDWD